MVERIHNSMLVLKYKLKTKWAEKFIFEKHCVETISHFKPTMVGWEI